MAQVIYVGVKNVSGEKANFVFDGDRVRFDKDEVKLFTRECANHAISRVNAISGKKTFKEIPLSEALKVVKEPENPSVVAAKREAEDLAKLEASITDKLLEKLKREGWQAPRQAPK